MKLLEEETPLPVLLFKVEFSYFGAHFAFGKRLKSAFIRYDLLDWSFDVKF